MNRSFLPIVIIFVVTTLVLVFVPLQFLWNMSAPVMIAGNIILFIATTISFTLNARSLDKENPHAFLRMVYGGMLAKMMICMFAALVYIGIVRKGVSKGAVFGFMFLYFVYTFVEISIIMKLSREKKHVKGKSTNLSN